MWTLLIFWQTESIIILKNWVAAEGSAVSIADGIDKGEVYRDIPRPF